MISDFSLELQTKPFYLLCVNSPGSDSGISPVLVLSRVVI